jgi:hypothetical protein
MAADPTMPPEPDFAYPKRFRLLKRIALIVALFLLTIGFLPWWWGHVAEVRVREVINAAYARGEPILPEDFVPDAIPNGANAAVTLGHAADAIVQDPNSDAMDTVWDGGAFTPVEVARTDVVAANNASALRLVRLARAQPWADWGLTFRRPVTKYLSLNHLSPQRELATIQQWVALRDHAKGNDGEAIEQVLDLLRQSEAIDQGPLTVISQLVANGISAMTTSLIDRITPDLHVRADDSPASGAATVAQIHKLIAALLDERGIRSSALRAWQGERMVALDDAETAAAGQEAFAQEPIAWLVAPMFRLDGVRQAHQISQIMKAVALPNWPAASAAMPPAVNQKQLAGFDFYVRLLSMMSVGWTNRSVQITFQTVTDRRAAAVELALHLYRRDHGKLPEKLSELVPSYLPALPADPMAADGRTFGYHPGAQPPVIYSVGTDGVDGGGTSLPDEANNHYRWRQPDAVYPLQPLPPATQPASPETQDHQ